MDLFLIERGTSTWCVHDRHVKDPETNTPLHAGVLHYKGVGKYIFSYSELPDGDAPSLEKKVEVEIQAPGVDEALTKVGEIIGKQQAVLRGKSANDDDESSRFSVDGVPPLKVLERTVTLLSNQTAEMLDAIGKKVVEIGLREYTAPALRNLTETAAKVAALTVDHKNESDVKALKALIISMFSNTYDETIKRVREDSKGGIGNVADAIGAILDRITKMTGGKTAGVVTVSSDSPLGRSIESLLNGEDEENEPKKKDMQ